MPAYTKDPLTNSSDPWSSLLSQGLEHYQNGRLDEARACCEKILSKDPAYAEGLHLTGVIYMAKGNYKAAIETLKTAVYHRPENAFYHNNLGNALQEAGKFKTAIENYRKALRYNPKQQEIYVNLGNACAKAGKTAEAFAAYGNSLQLNPDCAEAYFNMGNLQTKEGDLKGAADSYQKTLKAKPELFDACFNLANIYLEQQDSDAAVAYYRRCLGIKPDHFSSHLNLGNAFKQKGNLQAASDSYYRALKIKPDLLEAHNNLGNLHKDMGRFDLALQHYRQVLMYDASNETAQFNMGILLYENNHVTHAVSCFQKAIFIKKDFTEAFKYLGVALSRQSRQDEAVLCFEKALEIEPSDIEIRSYLIHQLQHICDWQNLGKLNKQLNSLIEKTIAADGDLTEPPFIALSRCMAPKYNCAAARARTKRLVDSKIYLSDYFNFEKRRSESTSSITIGYLSGDFHDHATSHLMLRVFGLHDRSAFKIQAYSYGPGDDSKYRRKIQQDCDRFVDVSSLANHEIAKKIYSDKVDILVDLKGHTRGGRLGICAYRPAPVQASYLGFPGTCGADFIDYIITDKIVSPPEHFPFYDEKFVYLANSYQVTDYHQEISQKVYRKTDFGFPADAFIFCSFNQSYKIDPKVFDTWMNILRRTARAYLWLLDCGESAKRNLKKEAAARGIIPDRIIFAEKWPKQEHLARYRVADLALDTRQVNGHTTTSDALWAGVPVVTQFGKHFASRVSASLLSAIDLPSLVTCDLAAYEDLAVGLAENREKLGNISKDLQKKRLTAPLFDTPRFVANIERAYKKMWYIFVKGQAPRVLDVNEQ